MARRVEQIQHQVPEREAEHGGRDRDAPLALELHPVAGGATLVAAPLHCAGFAGERAAVEQELLGQGRLPGVGMRDDGERTTSRRFLAGGAHHPRQPVHRGGCNVKPCRPAKRSPMNEPTLIDRLLSTPGHWAVVGCSPRPARDSHRIARLLRDEGHRITPVNPNVDGSILERPGRGRGRGHRRPDRRGRRVPPAAMPPACRGRCRHRRRSRSGVVAAGCDRPRCRRSGRSSGTGRGDGSLPGDRATARADSG